MNGWRNQAEPLLTVSVRPWAGGAVVVPEGELDHDTADLMRAALARQTGSPGAHLLVDCAGLRFCDSTGLNVILHARSAARAGGGGLDLIAPRPSLRRLLALTGTEEVFRVYPDLAEAEADAADRP